LAVAALADLKFGVYDSNPKLVKKPFKARQYFWRSEGERKKRNGYLPACPI